MNASPTNVSAEEREQIVETIEMFEVIVEANPQDCQSMEILKEAYQRLGRVKETLVMARRLAETYMELGQLSSAMLEYEGILQQDRDNLEIIAALGEVEERMHRTGVVRPAFDESVSTEFQAVPAESGTLIATPQTSRFEAVRPTGLRSDELANALAEDGNETLVKFLIQHRLAEEEVVLAALERVRKKNKGRTATTVCASLIDELINTGIDPGPLLCGILDRTKFAFIPIDYYDVDRQIVKMLPEGLTLGRLMLPFDLISRTIMIATANPFDSRGKEIVQQYLDYHIQWHLAVPSALIKVLTDTYRIATPGAAAHHA